MMADERSTAIDQLRGQTTEDAKNKLTKLADLSTTLYKDGPAGLLQKATKGVGDQMKDFDITKGLPEGSGVTSDGGDIGPSQATNVSPCEHKPPSNCAGVGIVDAIFKLTGIDKLKDEVVGTVLKNTGDFGKAVAKATGLTPTTTSISKEDGKTVVKQSFSFIPQEIRNLADSVEKDVLKKIPGVGDALNFLGI